MPYTVILCIFRFDESSNTDESIGVKGTEAIDSGFDSSFEPEVVDRANDNGNVADDVVVNGLRSSARLNDKKRVGNVHNYREATPRKRYVK